MAVVLQSQAEMADRLGVIARLCHGAQQLMGNHLLRGRPFRLLHDRRKIRRLDACAVPQGNRVQAQGPYQIGQGLHTVRCGLFVDAIHKGEVGAFRQLRRRLVCGNHQLLDHLLCLSALAGLYIHADALPVQYKAGLRAIQIHRSAALGARLQDFRKLPRCMERPDDRRIFFAQRFIRRPVEQLIDLAVNAAHLRIDDALPEAERKDRPLLVQFDDGGKREFILPRIERTNSALPAAWGSRGPQSKPTYRAPAPLSRWRFPP